MVEENRKVVKENTPSKAFTDRFPGWSPFAAGEGYIESAHGEFRVWLNICDDEPPPDLRACVEIHKGKESAWIWRDTLEPADERSRQIIENSFKKWRKVYVCSEGCGFRSYDRSEIDEENPVYECPDDGTVFSRDESSDGVSNRCPDCNKWGRKIYEGTCPRCGEGGVMPDREEVA